LLCRGQAAPDGTMSLVLAILSVIVGGGILALGIVFVRFNRVRLRIARVAAAATSDDLESIYRQIEDSSREIRPAACWLARMEGCRTDGVSSLCPIVSSTFRGRVAVWRSRLREKSRVVLSTSPCQRRLSRAACSDPSPCLESSCPPENSETSFRQSDLLPAAILLRPRCSRRVPRGPGSFCRTSCALAERVLSLNQSIRPESVLLPPGYKIPNGPFVRGVVGEWGSSCRSRAGFSQQRDVGRITGSGAGSTSSRRRRSNSSRDCGGGFTASGDGAQCEWSDLKTKRE
jgi:hypothetical protein